MKGNVPAEQALTNSEHPLPPRVQEALQELVGIAQEGLMALSVASARGGLGRAGGGGHRDLAHFIERTRQALGGMMARPSTVAEMPPPQ